MNSHEITYSDIRTVYLFDMEFHLNLPKYFVMALSKEKNKN